jgi:hypothetical protein
MKTFKLSSAIYLICLFIKNTKINNPLPNITFLVILAGLLMPWRGTAQSQINGKILDALANPVAHANVLLLSPLDSSLVKGCLSEENGSFTFDQLDRTDYLLSVNLMGYKKYWTQVEIKPKSTFDLQNIILSDSEEELEEIQVTAQKPLYERKIDRMVINVQASITAAGNTVLEVLQKSPGVMVNRQSNAIMLNGKGGVTIMINNRIQRLPMEVVFQMLDGMSAANIEKIELITHPPAKYDAEGTGGIIHLIMAESADLGTNGNFGLIAGMNARETLGANFNLNHRREKFSFFVDYSILNDPNIQSFENHIKINNPDFLTTIYSFMDRPYQLTTQSLRTGIELNLGSRTKVGSVLTATQRYYQMDASSVFHNRITPDSSSMGTIILDELNVWNHITSNIHFIHSFNSKSNLRLDLDYNWSRNNNPSNYQLDFTFPEINRSTREFINMTKVTPIHMKVAGFDYIYTPSAALKFEVGAKGIFSTFENDVEVIFTREGIRTRNDELSMLAFLEEDILAGYGSAEWIINEANQINAGLRFENTRTYISTAEERGIVDRNFGNFFPSLFYLKTINDNLSLNLGYSRRVQRPTFEQLAPFVFFMDPNLFFSGNPALLPALIDGIKTDINVKRANISLEYNRTRNPIAPFQPEFDATNNRQILRSQNLDYQKIYSINLSLPWIINDRWDVHLNSGGFYTMMRTSHFENNLDTEFFNFMSNLTTTFQLPKNYSIEANGIYYSRMNWGITYLKPIGTVNLGFQKILNKDRGTFRLSLIDIFYTQLFKFQNTIPEFNITNSFVIDPHMQAFKLNYTRSFGNKKLRGVDIKSGSEEIQKRTRVE